MHRENLRHVTGQFQRALIAQVELHTSLLCIINITNKFLTVSSVVYYWQSSPRLPSDSSHLYYSENFNRRLMSTAVICLHNTPFFLYNFVLLEDQGLPEEDFVK